MHLLIGLVLQIASILCNLSHEYYLFEKNYNVTVIKFALHTKNEGTYTIEF